MNLPFLKSEKPQKNFFLSLLYKPYKVSAILFEEINSKLFILSTSDQDTTKSADELTADELLNISDKVVSSVEPSLPEGATVEKTIFSVPYEWVTDGKISAEYLEKLKKVCQDLGLIPVGYLISIEAIISHLEHKEGAPVSAIFVEVAVKKMIVYLVRAGKILEVHSADIEKGALPTAESLLKQINTVDVLPSRIILLDYKNAAAMQQDFISHTWSSDISFLHLPQVLVLEKGFEDEAAVNGVAIQMDLEVLHDTSALRKVESENISIGDKKDIEEPFEKEEVTEEIEEASAEELGFVKERDVADEEIKMEEAEATGDGISDDGEPVIREAGKINEESNISIIEPNDPPESQDFDPETKNVAAGIPILSSLPMLSNFSFPSTIREIQRKIKIPNLKSFFAGGNNSMKIKAAIALGVVIVAIVIISVLYYNVILKAEVSVFSDRKTVDKSQEVTFSENPSDSSSIKITLKEQTEKGDDTKNASGTKDTGETAKGSIVVYNKTESEKSFPKGTVIVGPNSLEFETQSDIKIASTSAFSTSLSSASVKVEASKFGKEYNLPSGSNFTIKGSSSSNYIAKNSEALTGGTKKTTTVVSQKDLDQLLTQVEEKLEKNAIEAVKQQIGSSGDVIPQALSVDVVEKNYTKKVGAESGSVGISAEVRYSIGSYSRDDIQKVVDSLSSGDIPGTYKINMDNSKIEVVDVKVDNDNNASATLKVNATYEPEIDSAKLATELKGNGESKAIEKIKSINGVTDVVIKFSRKIPFFPNMLPANSKNIDVQVKK